MFQAIQFSINTQFNSIWPIDWAVNNATSRGRSGPASDGNEGMLRIHQSPSIIGTSLLDCLVSTGMQSVYSATPADWATVFVSVCLCLGV